jgi:sulfatase maturation enzyme AslB (radical SAM superfamily)
MSSSSRSASATKGSIEGYRLECLTLGLGSPCALACAYCYASASAAAPRGLDIGDDEWGRGVAAAARLVASSCSLAGRKLAFGFQGGGESFERVERMRAALAIARTEASAFGIGLFSFATTNGSGKREDYLELASAFDRICLSIDGPPDLHDAERPRRDGSGSYADALLALEALRRGGADPAARATATARNVMRLPESVRHLAGDLGLRDIQVEPAYRVSGENMAAADFVSAFLEARRIAEGFGARLGYSGCRPEEGHGAYCAPAKRVLFVGPELVASLCPFSEPSSVEYPLAAGFYEAKTDEFRLFSDRIEAAASPSLPEACGDCELSSSCCLGCPDTCLLADPGADPRTSLRCRINRLLASAGR